MAEIGLHSIAKYYFTGKEYENNKYIIELFVKCIWFTRKLFLLLRSLWLGSLVNRASDSGSEGRGFESLPGHKENP